eukprot:TRINITY_DN48093_c0_g1_i1.p1 TRINITY_DN48093_c0_g1~~TRINITY_DN48093_c0_g1_i1.p1  ORF type:complete len:357 (+),score=78.50 TRINITY_DN48093_c0_g1_i1:61-1071(+)
MASSPAASPASHQSLLTDEEVSSRGPACKTLGWQLCCFFAIVSFATVLLRMAPATHPKGAAGVHYGVLLPATGNADHEPVMTDQPGGVHYLIQGKPAGPLPKPEPMTAGYREIAEIAGEDLVFLKWLASQGDIVQAGDPLLEYSKGGQQLQLKASSSGQIKELVKVGKGEVLSKDSKLAIFGHPAPQLPVAPNFDSSILGAAFLVLVSIMFVAIVVIGVTRVETVIENNASIEDGVAGDAPVEPASSGPAPEGLQQAEQAFIYTKALSVPMYVPGHLTRPTAVPTPTVPAAQALVPQAPQEVQKSKQGKAAAPGLPRLAKAAAEAAQARVTASNVE